MVFFSLSILEKKKSAHKHTTGFICGRRNATIIRLRSRYKKLPCAKSASPMPRHGPASARPVPSCYLDIFISTHAYIYLYIKGSTTVDEEKSGVCINPFGFCWLETEKRKKERTQVGMKYKVSAAVAMIMQSHERGKHPRAIDDDRDTFQSPLLSKGQASTIIIQATEVCLATTWPPS